MISDVADEIWCRSHTLIHTNTHTHTHLHSEYIFHILSTGHVMMPVIKMGNCLTVVPCDWIQGQFCRHNQKQLDVKPLSSEIESKAEQTYRRWYQHQREMVVLWIWPLWMAFSPPFTLSPLRRSLTLSPRILELDTWFATKSDKDPAQWNPAMKDIWHRGTNTLYDGANCPIWSQQLLLQRSAADHILAKHLQINI